MAKLNLKEERKYAKENKSITTHTRNCSCCNTWFHTVYSVPDYLYRLGSVRIGGNMKRGEIYYIENDNAVGCEQRGRRPAVIVGNDIGNQYSPVLLVVYFTLQPKKHLPTHVYVRGYGTALCEQIFTIDRTRLLQKKKGECTSSDMERINKALCISLGMEETWQNERATNTHRYRNERR